MLTVVDEIRSFFPAAQRHTSGFDGLRGIPSRGCALQLDIVEEMAGGRQEARNREAGRRKDGTTYDPRTPRKGRLRPVKLQLIHADWQDVDYRPADCWRRGGRWPNSYESKSRPFPFALPRLSPFGLHATFSADGGRRDAFLLSPAAQRHTSGFDGLRGIPSRGCALQLDIVQEIAGGRQEARNREAGRRNDGTTYDPPHTAEGPPQDSQAAAYPPSCSFHLLPILVYRKRHVPWPFLPPKPVSWFCACVSQLCLLK